MPRRVKKIRGYIKRNEGYDEIPIRKNNKIVLRNKNQRFHNNKNTSKKRKNDKILSKKRNTDVNYKYQYDSHCEDNYNYNNLNFSIYRSNQNLLYSKQRCRCYYDESCFYCLNIDKNYNNHEVEVYDYGSKDFYDKLNLNLILEKSLACYKKCNIISVMETTTKICDAYYNFLKDIILKILCIKVPYDIAEIIISLSFNKKVTYEIEHMKKNMKKEINYNDLKVTRNIIIEYSCVFKELFDIYNYNDIYCGFECKDKIYKLAQANAEIIYCIVNIYKLTQHR